MKIHLLLVTALLVLCTPVLVQADASVRQDSCVVVGEDQIRVYFTVFNEGLPRGICAFEMVPAHQPATPQCTAVGSGAPNGWAYGLNQTGGAWFDAMPQDPSGIYCIAPYKAKGGFYITFDPGFCCYRFHYADDTGQVFMTEKECLTYCASVPVELKSWGAIKQIYQD